MFRILAGWLMVVALAASAGAQTGSITGRVTDEGGGAVARAAISVTGASSLRTIASESGADGGYAVDGLAPGRYVVAVAAPGFAAVTREVTTRATGATALDVVLVVDGVREDVTVRSATSRVIGKSTLPARDQPLTVNTVDAEFLKAYAINDLVEALGNVSNLNAYTQYGVYEYYTIRGFGESVQLVDGIRNEGNRVRTQLSNVERVEVLKGPSSVLYGSEAFGATVNIVLKQPSREPVYDFSFGAGSWNTYRAAFGAAGRLVGDHTTYRVDLGVDSSDNFRHDPWTRVNVTPTVAWQISDRDLLDVRHAYNRNDLSGDGGIPQVTGAEGALSIPRVPRDRRYNTPQDFSLSTDHNLRASYSRALSGAWGLRDVFGYRHYDDEYWVAESLTVTAPSTVNREFLYFKHARRPFLNQLELTGRHRLLVDHDLLVGWEHQGNGGRTFRSNAASVKTTPIDLYDPVETHVTNTDFSVSRIDHYRNRTNAFYFQDNLTLHARLKAVVGGRVDDVDRRTYNNPVTNGAETPGPVVERATRRFTPRVGVVYQPRDTVDLYAQYSSAFRPNFNLQPDGTPLEPEFGAQWEVGQRLRLAQQRLSITTAVFNIQKRNVALSRPGGFYDMAGKVRSRGAEVDFEGRLAPGVRVTAGYGYTDAVYVDYVTSTADLSGRHRPRTPKHSFNLSASASWRNGIALSFATRALGDQFLNDANTLAFDGYRLINVAASYSHGPLQYAVSLNNLTDTEYWASTLGNRQFYPGEPRRVTGTVRVRLGR